MGLGIAANALANPLAALGAGAPATIDARPRGVEAMMQLQPVLTGVRWQWHGNVAGDGSVTLTPDHRANYTVTLLPEGVLSIQADCNHATGSWTEAGTGVDLVVGGVTRRGCPPGSFMYPFLNALDAVISHGSQDGFLALALPDGGMMVFAPIAIAPEPTTPATG